jgi:hypothetical protein
VSRRLALLILALLLPAGSVRAAVREMYRVRIGNRKGGAIEISLDEGRNWRTLGRVTQPATDTAPGFAALAGAPSGAVAAISRDALTVRTDLPPTSGAPKARIFRLLPRGGTAAGAAILTDVPRGRALFGALAPPLGSELLLEAAGGGPRRLPGGYIPRPGDRLVIVATAPTDAPAMLVIENREGGRVLSVSPSGDETVVGHVRRPLRGVARYPITEGARPGAVVAHHPASITVATTPAEGARPDGVQRAGGDEIAGPGGFLIQAEASAGGLKAEEGSVLVVDRLSASGPPLAVTLALTSDGSPLAGETRVEARLDGGPWEPLPALGGAQPAGLTAAALSQRFAAEGNPRGLGDGITHLRLILAPTSPERLRAAVAAALAPPGTHPPRAVPTSDQSTRIAAIPAPPSRRLPAPAGAPTAKGRSAKGSAPNTRKATKTLRIVANIQGQGIVYVMFYVDGQIRKMTNRAPYEWLWDTRTVRNGPHSLEIRGADADGRILTTQTREVAVYN